MASNTISRSEVEQAAAPVAYSTRLSLIHISSPVYKLAFLASGTVEINEGVKRIDKIFEEKKTM